MISESILNYRFQQGFLVTPSNLPGMDFTTHVMSSEHKVNS